MRDEHLWAEKYSGTLEDIFDIQEQISRRIVDALKMRLSPGEDRKLAERPIDNVKALECYQRSRQEMYKFTREGLDQALALIDTALGIVGDNEHLYAAKGSVHWQYVNAAIRPTSATSSRQECVRRVFALNPDSAAGHALHGMVRQAQGRPAGAIASFKRALAAGPADVYVGELGRIYGQLGRDRESREMMAQALREDSLNPINHHRRLWNALISGNTDLVQQDAPRLLRLVPEFAMLRWDLAVSLIQDDRMEDARAVLDAAPDEKVATIARRLYLFLKLAFDGRQRRPPVVLASTFWCVHGTWSTGRGSWPSATRSSASRSGPSRTRHCHYDDGEHPHSEVQHAESSVASFRHGSDRRTVSCGCCRRSRPAAAFAL